MSKAHPVRLAIIATALGVATLGLAACGDSGSRRSGSVVVTPVDPPPGVDPALGRTRYSFNNRCVALKSNSSGKYVAVNGTGYAATADSVAGSEPFFMKPTLLGEYALMNRAGTLLNAAATVGNAAVATATDTASFRLLADGDTTAYPPTPQYDVAMTEATITTYRNFVDPNILGKVFTLANPANGQRLSATASDALVMVAGDTPDQRFVLEEVSGCTAFPEASSNASGETFKGTTSDGRVLGMADVHVHTSSSTFLGGALTGRVFHKFGPLQAMPDCAAEHGPQGSQDVLGAAFIGDTDGHVTTGWPQHPEWPTKDALSHRAIYWKWIERAWLGGLRVMVNDLVENATLCELQAKAKGSAQDCNEMNSARRQVGTMYALQDYIDAQYGGRGKGFLQIVLTPEEARARIADGKMAMVLGIEISNLFDCQITYSPLRQMEPFEETGTGPTENRYACAMTETGAPNEILTQLLELKSLGVRQIITIHEFDNAFGGNGIFNGEILNLGNRENSGGIPSGTPSGGFGTTPPETATGEFWTTYDCPEENVTPNFSGYMWGDRGGAVMTNVGPPPPLCQYTGQGGRPGGTTACYPAKPQCNARWLTPIGVYTYQKLMEQGMIFDYDHLEVAMKTQVMEMAEAQRIPFPFVSTHGTFGGTTNDQAKRTLKNGGHLYPSIGSTRGFLGDMAETRQLAIEAGSTHLFGFGFGTDTDGLSGQMGPRGEIAAGKEVKYPFTLFSTAPFTQLQDFAGAKPVVFAQPEERNVAGQGRTWHQDMDGNAHYGMMADFVEEMRQEATPQEMQTLFNSAEVYLRTWEITEDSAAAIQQDGFVMPPGVLRAAPGPGQVSTYQ